MRHRVMKHDPILENWMSDPPAFVVRQSFDQFYRQNYPAVVGLVFTLSGSRMAAEDLAQEAFLKAHRAWSEVSDHPNPAGWVRRVAINLCRSSFRRLGAEARALGRLAGLRHAPFPEIEPSNDQFWATVRSLPRRQAEVVALHYLEDMSVADVARVLGIAESSVKNSLAQARATLARKLEVEA